jgi:hypothetical protein
MYELEETTIAALETLFHTIDILQNTNTRDILKPDVYIHHKKTLQVAYEALT